MSERLTDEQIAELRDAIEGSLPTRLDLLFGALIVEVRASRAARAESEGTRLDGTLYERCPLCLTRTAGADRLARECRDDKETP